MTLVYIECTLIAILLLAKFYCAYHRIGVYNFWKHCLHKRHWVISKFSDFVLNKSEMLVQSCIKRYFFLKNFLDWKFNRFHWRAAACFLQDISKRWVNLIKTCLQGKSATFQAYKQCEYQQHYQQHVPNLNILWWLNEPSDHWQKLLDSKNEINFSWNTFVYNSTRISYP